jgi:hypothetical protein
MTAEERAKGIAPDIVSDVAEWGYRPSYGKDFKDMTPEELAAADAEAAKILARLQEIRSRQD